MKKINFKSRKGFTLIELLVVIGILAVLAAIAIPSVAGLIDRANVSADDTNANEMTNAIERFTSEYELVCQDIASGRFNPDDLDGAQSRVYNSIGITERKDITDIEGEDGFSGKRINPDTKYPTNILTIKSIIENYTKTSSATFDPKQSDNHFYYSPDCGLVITAPENSSTSELNKYVISGKNAKGQALGEDTTWIDLTLEAPLINDTHNGKTIPENATYTTSEGEVLNADNDFPVPSVNDTYVYNGYKYIMTDNVVNGLGWRVETIDKTATTYPQIETYINDTPIVSMMRTYANCSNLVSLPDGFTVPSTVVNLTGCFTNCKALELLPSSFKINNNTRTMGSMFANCSSLKTLNGTFVIPKSVNQYSQIFVKCSEFSGDIVIYSKSTPLSPFSETTKPITLTVVDEEASVTLHGFYDSQSNIIFK